jgi:hypothetical protein
MTGTPMPDAILENSPLPLAGIPTTPITFIGYLSDLSCSYPYGPAKFVSNLLDIRQCQRGMQFLETSSFTDIFPMTDIRYCSIQGSDLVLALLENKGDSADLGSDLFDVILILIENGYHDLEFTELLFPKGFFADRDGFFNIFLVVVPGYRDLSTRY